MKDTLDITQLFDYSTPGIWGILNRKDNRFFISYSNNILSAVSRNIAQIRDKCHPCRELVTDLNNLELFLFSCPNTSSKDRKIKITEVSNQFKSMGYTPYNTKPAVSYKLRTAISTDYKIHVLLVNKRNDKVLVGIFTTIEDANSFIQSNYPNNQIHKVTYSTNSLTKEFYNNCKEVVV